MHLLLVSYFVTHCFVPFPFQENPTFDPWCIPHSCGQQCGKRLNPDCGHDCLLLCHPGNEIAIMNCNPGQNLLLGDLRKKASR